MSPRPFLSKLNRSGRLGFDGLIVEPTLKVVGHLPSRLVPIGGDLGHCRQDDRFQISGDRSVDLARRQRLITGNRPEQLLTVLADRQTLLDELHQLAERMRPYQERWPDLRATLHQGKVDEIDRLLKEVNQLLRGILEKDKADAQLLAAQKQTTGAAIASCKAGRKAETAYATQAYGQQACRDWTDQ